MAALLLSILLNEALLSQATTGKTPKNSDIENIGKRDINKGQINLTSLDGEARIGREASAEVQRGVTLVEDSEINEYVDRIAQVIAKNSDSKFPIAIRVIRSEDMNAFALPGGFIYVNTGTIKAVDSEAELAFVIAHLIGHVAARHATENDSKANLLQIASIPAMIQTSGVGGAAIQQAPNTLPISMVRFFQEAVVEADFLGLQYLYKAGYDPQAAVGFLRKIGVAEASRPKQPPMFNTKPPIAERVELMEKNIRNVLPALATSVTDTSEFEAIKVRVSR
jgi:beta-barrel assembly-enhancing protease